VVDKTYLSGGDPQFEIYAVDEDDHTAPTSYAEWNTDHGIHTTASESWDPSSSGVNVGDVLTTVDISSVIQEIVNRGSWVSGNAIGIHFDPDETTESVQKLWTFAEYSNATYDPPELTITVAGGTSATDPTVTTTYDITVAAVSQPATATDPEVTAGLQLLPALMSQLLQSHDPTVVEDLLLTPTLASQILAALAPVLTTTYDITPGLTSQLLGSTDPTVDVGAVNIVPGLTSQLIGPLAATVSAGETYLTPDLTSQLLGSTDPTIAVYVSPGLASQLAAATDPEVAADAITVAPGLASLTVTPFGPTFQLDITPGLASQLAAGTDPLVAVTQAITTALESQLLTATDPSVDVGDVTITPELTVQLVVATMPTLSGGRVDIREIGIFVRLPNAEPILVLAFGPDRSRLTSHTDSEGWEKVSGHFAFPWDTRDAVLATIQAAWVANKAGTVAALTTALNNALNAAGYRRADGTAVDETGVMT